SGEVPPPVMRAIQTAQGALRDVLALLTTNRALTKPPVSSRMSIGDLLTRSAERVYVALQCATPDVTVDVPPPAMIHALSLVLDVAGGPGRGRTVEATAALDGAAIAISFGASSECPPHTSEALALAGFALQRERGSLSCASQGSRLVVRLPIVADQSPQPSSTP